MKKISILSLVVLCILLLSKMSYSISLVEVNPQWIYKSELKISSQVYRPSSEHGAIAQHLQLVEFFLRNKNINHLSNNQKNNRSKCLDYLHEYWNQEQFPINTIYTNRTPIFIDEYDNFCAVGYLMKRSGHEDLARKIQQQNNLVYVKQITNTDAITWIKESGLSVDECAWIQPSYGNPTFFKNCGYGTNGTIYELKTINNELYVGGDFTKVDSTITSYGLAKLVKNNNIYNWQDMSLGLPLNYVLGDPEPSLQIKAIETFDNKLFAGGVFRDYGSAVNYESVYYYDGTQFNKCEGVFGPVHDFEVYNGKLYMSGLFKLGTSDYASLAHWDVSTQKWVYDFVIYTTASPIYKMTTYDNKLILGGSFMNVQNSKNVLAYDGTVTYPLYTGLDNEVYALTVFNNKLYAGGKINGITSSYTMKYYNGTNWVDTNQLYLPYANRINTLYATPSNLFWGGDFKNYGMMFSSSNLMCTNGPQGWGMMDTNVNVIEEYDGKIFIGGLFNKIASNFNYNHIAYIDNMPNNITPITNKDITIYPNPSNDFLNVQHIEPQTKFFISTISGSIVLKGDVMANRIDIRSLTNGIYFISLMVKDQTVRRLKFIKN